MGYTNAGTTGLGVTRRGLLGGLAAVSVAGAAAAAVPGLAAEQTTGNRVCEALGIEKPVVQALMMGLTSPELSAAVSEAGGLGILELPSAETLAAVRELTSKPVCAGVYAYDEATAGMLKDAGVDIVICANGGAASQNGFSIDVEPIRQFKEAGFKVLYKGLNATRENILAAQEAGADAIVVIGYGAGGCGPVVAANTAELIAELSQVVDVPLLAAGGIVNARTAAVASAAGAEGAYVGTRFLACEEAPCGDATKQAIVDARPEDLKPVPWDAGSDGYMLETPSALRDEALALAAQGASAAEVFGVSSPIYAAMASGDVDETGICVGCGVGMIDEVGTAAAIVADIASGFGA